MIKILFVDDEKEIRRFVKRYFSAAGGYRLIEASCSQEALSGLGQDPDIIVLDIMMPGMDGLELCRQIRSRIDCPILFLTAKSAEQERLLGFAAGADDYIVKPFSVRELHARIDAHLRKLQRQTRQNRIDYGGLWIDYEARQVGTGDYDVDLAKKEFEILELLAMNPGLVFSRSSIYEHIWGYDADGDAQTAVTEHIKRLRQKLGQPGERIETVWGVGYRWKR